MHRIKKQIEKLSEDKKTMLLTYHYDKISQLSTKQFFKDYEKNREHALEDDDITSRHLARVMHMFINTLVHLMDMYHLARMLYYMDKTTNIISYTGSHHTHNYMEFFEKYMGLKLSYIDDKSNVEKGMEQVLDVKVPMYLIDG